MNKGSTSSLKGQSNLNQLNEVSWNDIHWDRGDNSCWSEWEFLEQAIQIKSFHVHDKTIVTDTFL